MSLMVWHIDGDQIRSASCVCVTFAAPDRRKCGVVVLTKRLCIFVCVGVREGGRSRPREKLESQRKGMAVTSMSALFELFFA